MAIGSAVAGRGWAYLECYRWQDAYRNLLFISNTPSPEDMVDDHAIMPVQKKTPVALPTPWGYRRVSADVCSQYSMTVPLYPPLADTFIFNTDSDQKGIYP